MPDPRSDRALLAAHVDGHPDAFDELVRRWSDRLWRLALRTLVDRDEAADALQDAFVSAFRAADTYRGDSEVSTWLHRIVLNSCRDRMRRQRVRATSSLTWRHDRPTGRDPVEDHLMRMTVDEALATLPTGQRLAVVLVDMQGFTIAEAAELLEVREGTIKSRCARARLRLAYALRHLGVSEPGGEPGNRSGTPRVEPGAGHGGEGPERSTAGGGDDDAPR